MAAGEPWLIGLGARVHLFVQPEWRAAFAAVFRDVLGCGVLERDFGLEHPVLLVRFDDGSSFSVESSKHAPSPLPTRLTVDAEAFRGAWIEFRVRRVDLVQARLREAGVPEFRHLGSAHAYFVAPGAQVFRILDADDVGP